MDRVTVDLLDDDYVASEDEETGPDLAHAPTEVSVRYLVDLGMAEMDARHLIAIAKGEAPSNARAAHASAPESPSP